MKVLGLLVGFRWSLVPPAGIGKRMLDWLGRRSG